MKSEIKAKIISDSYVCNAGFWTTDYYVETEGKEDFDYIKKKFVDKRVKITIEEIDDEILCANCGGREVEEEGDFCDNCLE